MLFRRLLAPVLALLLALAPAGAVTNPGVCTLASVSVTAALTSSAQTAITDLNGAIAASIKAA